MVALLSRPPRARGQPHRIKPRAARSSPAAASCSL